MKSLSISKIILDSHHLMKINLDTYSISDIFAIVTTLICLIKFIHKYMNLNAKYNQYYIPFKKWSYNKYLANFSTGELSALQDLFQSITSNDNGTLIHCIRSAWGLGSVQDSNSEYANSIRSLIDKGVLKYVRTDSHVSYAGYILESEIEFTDKYYDYFTFTYEM